MEEETNGLAAHGASDEGGPPQQDVQMSDNAGVGNNNGQHPPKSDKYTPLSDPAPPERKRVRLADEMEDAKMSELFRCPSGRSAASSPEVCPREMELDITEQDRKPVSSRASVEISTFRPRRMSGLGKEMSASGYDRTENTKSQMHPFDLNYQRTTDFSSRNIMDKYLAGLKMVGSNHQTTCVNPRMTNPVGSEITGFQASQMDNTDSQWEPEPVCNKHLKSEINSEPERNLESDVPGLESESERKTEPAASSQSLSKRSDGPFGWLNANSDSSKSFPFSKVVGIEKEKKIFKLDEISREILRYVFTQEEHINPYYEYCSPRIPESRLYGYKNIDLSRLVLGNRKWYEEASAIFYGHNIFEFQNADVARWWLVRIGNNLKKVKQVNFVLDDGEVSRTAGPTRREKRWYNLFAWLETRHRLQTISISFKRWEDLVLPNDDEMQLIRANLVMCLMDYRGIKRAKIEASESGSPVSVYITRAIKKAMRLNPRESCEEVDAWKRQYERVYGKPRAYWSKGNMVVPDRPRYEDKKTPETSENQRKARTIALLQTISELSEERQTPRANALSKENLEPSKHEVAVRAILPSQEIPDQKVSILSEEDQILLAVELSKQDDEFRRATALSLETKEQNDPDRKDTSDSSGSDTITQKPAYRRIAPKPPAISKQNTISPKNGAWSKSQDEILTEIIDRLGTKNWSKIGSELNKDLAIVVRTPAECQSRYIEISTPVNKTPAGKNLAHEIPASSDQNDKISGKGGSGAKTDESILFKLVDWPGADGWAKMSAEHGMKRPDQCQERHCHPKPTVETTANDTQPNNTSAENVSAGKAPAVPNRANTTPDPIVNWSPSEDRLLRELVAQYHSAPVDWESIASEIITKTVKQCKKRYDLRFGSSQQGSSP